jgi:hypothetical protein
MTCHFLPFLIFKDIQTGLSIVYVEPAIEDA